MSGPLTRPGDTQGASPITPQQTGGGGGVTAVTATAPIASSGGAAPVISLVAGNVPVILQAIAGGSFRGGSHATAPVGEVVLQVKTTTGAPTHTATEGTPCWNSVDNLLYVNSDGATTWLIIGAAGGTPGGSNTQLQYNNLAAFGGTSGLTWDGTNLLLALTRELRFRDANSSLLSPASGSLRIKATVEHLFQSAGFFFLDYAATHYVLTVVDVASAVNYLEIKNAVAGGNPLISVLGSDANRGLNIVTAGTGRLQENGADIPDFLSCQVFGA